MKLKQKITKYYPVCTLFAQLRKIILFHIVISNEDNLPMLL